VHLLFIKFRAAFGAGWEKRHLVAILPQEARPIFHHGQFELFSVHLHAQP